MTNINGTKTNTEQAQIPHTGAQEAKVSERAIRCFILVLSDKASRGEREDLTGPSLRDQVATWLGFDTPVVEVLPDTEQLIVERLIRAVDEEQYDLIFTCGGTGFSPRDCTPEATRKVVDRLCPGLMQLLIQESLKLTPLAALSRAVCGLRRQSLIVNLPGSPRASRENSEIIRPLLAHALPTLRGETVECAKLHDHRKVVKQGEATIQASQIAQTAQPQAPQHQGQVLSVNISLEKGMPKQPVDSIRLIENYGVEGDAHAGNWHRQVSLLAMESIDKMQAKMQRPLRPGDFAENLTIEGFDLLALPVGTQIQVGDCLLEITQIGKVCHNSGCAIKKATGSCVMPREGIFAKVLRGGLLRAGDVVTRLSEPMSGSQSNSQSSTLSEPRSASQAEPQSGLQSEQDQTKTPDSSQEV